VCIGAALALGALVGGCDQRGYLNTPQTVTVTLEEAGSPEAVVRSMLTTIRNRVRAAANHDDKAAKRAQERMVALAAREAIHQRFEQQPVYRMLVGDNEVEGLTSLWAAALAYYAKGFDFRRMRTVGSAQAGEAVVFVPANAPDDKAVLRITCVRQPDGRWAVSRIDFATQMPPPATQPVAAQPATTRPVTQP